MGNITCCAGLKKRHSGSDKLNISNLQVEYFNGQKSETPYDNVNVSTSLRKDSFSFSTEEKENSCSVESPLMAQRFLNENETQNAISVLYPQTPLTSCSDNVRSTSFFSSEDVTEDEEESPKHINSEVYNIVLKEFLLNYFPFNNQIINEMVNKNLLLHQDAIPILLCENNREKASLFLNNFVFSEINICKLATFLHILLTEKSQILTSFNKTETFFRVIVDHIYYIINILSLITEFSNEKENIQNVKSITSMIKINSVENGNGFKRKQIRILETVSYVRIYFNNVTFSSCFWEIFSIINEQFCCCQELILSSCNLNQFDVINVVKGFEKSGILTYLDLSSNPINNEGLKYIENLFLKNNSLISLNLACCSLTELGMGDFLEVLSNNISNVHLKLLNISHNELSNMTERHILLLTKIPLSSLEMKSINLQYQKTLFQSLKLNYSLKRVDFSANKLQNNDVIYLAAGLAYNSNLKRISLAMTGLLKSDCFTINNTLLMNKSLVSIDLSDNLIEDEGAELLKDIFTMKKTLKEIYLRRCGISLNGILILLKSVYCQECTVKLLDLCYNQSTKVIAVVNIKDVIRKLNDLLHHISLVKDIKILLWGTIEQFSFISEHVNCKK